MVRWRFVISVIAALYFGALIGLAFVPGSLANRVSWVWPLAAFVPVGIFLVLLLSRRRWRAAVAFGVLGSAWIEAAQTVWMPVGYAEAIDLVWASSGAVVGVAIAVVFTIPRRTSLRSHEPHRIVPHPSNREIPQD